VPTEAATRVDAAMGVVPWWIETHCVIPDGFRAGQPFRLYDDQLLYLANFYLVRGDAEWNPTNPLFSTAFRYRRGMNVGPQKVGKSPGSAAQICLEGVGPSVFAGWAEPAIDTSASSTAAAAAGVRVRAGEPMGMAPPDAVHPDHRGQRGPDRQRLPGPPADDREGPAPLPHAEDRRGLHPAAGRRPGRARHELGPVPDRRSIDVRRRDRGPGSTRSATGCATRPTRSTGTSPA
jgi:hypothetical protein